MPSTFAIIANTK
jgi:pyruvate dehydrogenase kinase 2/3/4